MTSLRMKMVMLVLSIAAVMLPLVAFADDNEGEGHQHARMLLAVITSDTGNDIPFHGLFYCRECKERFSDSITPDDIGMPIINITGSMEGMSKDEKKTVDISYMSGDLQFESSATMKWQGASSAGYPKKNYSIQFIKPSGDKNKIKLVDSWGKQSKYCLKANYVDFSQSRNVVSGRIFSQIVHSRGIDDELNALPNGGVVDGYPVALYKEGKYLGLYTLNIPKDKWMFGMKDETLRQALLFGETWSDSVALRKQIPNVNKVSSGGWEIEYCSTEDDPQVGTAWAAESMNAFISFLNENDGDAFKAGIGEYTDVDRAIDVLLYTYFIHAYDNVSKNIVWATYDGVRWIPSVYDMDGTWGMYWNGSIPNAANDFAPSGDNMLFRRLLDNYPEEIKARYVQLREKILSRYNIHNQFQAFFDGIPRCMYAAEQVKWKDVPSNTVDQQEQIYGFIDARCAHLDDYYGVTVEEYQGQDPDPDPQIDPDPDPQPQPDPPVVTPGKPVVSKIVTGKKKLTVKMKAKPAAVGAETYQIAYRVKGTSKWKTVSTNKQSLVIKGLKKGKKYQVRTRACNASTGSMVCSKWTATKTTSRIR